MLFSLSLSRYDHSGSRRQMYSPMFFFFPSANSLVSSSISFPFGRYKTSQNVAIGLVGWLPTNHGTLGRIPMNTLSAFPSLPNAITRSRYTCGTNRIGKEAKYKTNKELTPRKRLARPTRCGCVLIDSQPCPRPRLVGDKHFFFSF